jgi:hypothetical protein
MTCYNATTGCLEKAIEGNKYVALIYSWSQCTDEILLQMLRRATEILGIHLFWVDRWCIQQGGTDDKKLEIPKMRKIYGEAELVLALLPGLTEKLVLSQPTEE